MQDAFTKYAKFAFSELNKDKNMQSTIPLRVINVGSEGLRAKIKQIEQHEAFFKLTKETRVAYGNGYHKYGNEKSSFHQEIWVGALQNFFRRSGFYLNCFEGISFDPEKLFNLYCQSFSRKEMQITYLAPIASVELDIGKEVVEFNGFTIRQFSELDKNSWQALNRVNEVFYPGAVIDLDDALNKRLIADYSFLIKVVSSPIPRLVKDNDFFNLAEMERHRVEFSNYSEIEDALKQMVLFDWESQFFDNGIGFDVPLIFNFDDNLLGHPRFAPDLSFLATVPDIWVDPLSGEEIEKEKVPFLFYLTPKETHELRQFLKSIGKTLASLKRKGPGWEFIEVALGFLLKAFFSKGIEQLLWHITVIESLLGEKVDELNTKLSERLSRIWGDTSTGICFKKLYDYRCDLVHGNKKVLRNEIHEDQLKEARVLARGTVCWFINYLSYLLDSNKSPKRSNVLKIIDGDEANNDSLTDVFACLPENFPSIRKWLGLREEHAQKFSNKENFSSDKNRQ